MKYFSDELYVKSDIYQTKRGFLPSGDFLFYLHFSCCSLHNAPLVYFISSLRAL